MSNHRDIPPQVARLPEEPVQRLMGPFARFMRIEAACGAVLLVCAIVALWAANSSFSEAYLAFWETPVGFAIGSDEIRHSLRHWINDGLMTIFFFVVGLEVKRELVLGELRDPKRAVLPIAAAIGGMVAPATIYLAMQWGQPGQRGWGMPMATDIAFVVGVMTVLGSRVPRSLRVMLLTLAIVDDIGAIVVIAVGYTEQLNWGALGWGLLGIGVIAVLARIGVRNIGVYTVAGVLVWFQFHESGIHATIAGVILGLLTPSRSWVSSGMLREIVGFFYGEGVPQASGNYQALRQIERASREAISPLERLENTLHPWMAFVIMPLFALANAGVPFELGDVISPVSLAVILGLFLGKPLGIVVASWLAVKSGIARIPEGVGWSTILAGGFLGGIGFTMSLFIAGLALSGELLTTAKIGILVGSLVSAIVGICLFFVIAPPESKAAR